jgi:nucleotide-binding universal stress UspA family protein
MYPFRTILIPTDFSTAAEWVFDDAVRIAGTNGAELVILHIRMTRSGAPGELRFPADTALYDYAETIELEKLRDRVRAANASIRTRLVVRQAPDPGPEIHRAAAGEHADLIVTATHARHHVAHLLIGSTTLEVITNPPVPVLAIRYGIQKRQSMRKILVPVHPKQTSTAALDLAAAIARHDGGEVSLLTVCDASDVPGATDNAARVAAEKLAGVEHRTEVVIGTDIDRELARYAARIDADAVFLNSRDDLTPLKIEIIRNVSVPVMIVPPAS